MPITKGQGQSDSTEFKERGLGAAFAINLRIFQSRFGDDERATYFHFDLNSGSGFNEESNCIGSPLAYLRAAKNVGVQRFFAGFVDIDGPTIKALMLQSEMQDVRCFPFHGDNRLFPDAIPEIVKQRGERPQYVMGSVLCDPNGTQIPFNALATLAGACPRLDIFINWNSAAFKRQQGANGSLIEMLETVPKEHWLIRRPIGKHQWTLLLGRNYKVNDHAAMGFHHLDSFIGQKILRECHFTKSELNERAGVPQIGLF